MPEKSVQEGWTLLGDGEDKIHDVTPDMLDWFFDNMEKGFHLWHPTQHKAFEWEVSPSKVGHVGSVQLTWQKATDDGPVQKIRIEAIDVGLCPIPITHEHITVFCGQFDSEGKPLHIVIHQWEAASYGTRHRSTAVGRGPRAKVTPPKVSQSGPTHQQVEMARLSEFLPGLYKMWQVVTDPVINVPSCLKVKKLPNGKWVYVAPYRPATK
jgi:hypothetical protein